MRKTKVRALIAQRNACHAGAAATRADVGDILDQLLPSLTLAQKGLCSSKVELEKLEMPMRWLTFFVNDAKQISD